MSNDAGHIRQFVEAGSRYPRVDSTMREDDGRVAGPVRALAEHANLPSLVAKHIRPGGECEVNASVEVGCLVAGMTAGADSVYDVARNPAEQRHEQVTARSTDRSGSDRSVASVYFDSN